MSSPKVANAVSMEIHPAPGGSSHSETLPVTSSTAIPIGVPPSATSANISKQFDGRRHFFKGFFYKNPAYDVEKHGPVENVPQHFHRDVLNRQTYRPKDLLRYISPTYGKPFHMLVQAAENSWSQPPDDWRRRRVTGSAPTVLTVSTWVVEHEINDFVDYFVKAGKAIVSIPVIFFLITYPIGGSGLATPFYKDYPGRCYEYPKHAMNKLDANPQASYNVKGQRDDDSHITYITNREQKRLLRPRKIVVRDQGQWVILPGENYNGPYLFISYAAKYYTDDASKAQLEARAQALAVELGTNAYWADWRCRAEKQPELTDDVHRFCDVTRGAEKVCILLPEWEDPDVALMQWGERMWCLPEALLARDHKVMILGQNRRETVDLMDLVYRAWAIDPNNAHATEQDFRLIVEHFTGTLKLSRLQLVSVALRVLRSRQWTEFQQGDIAYALMTLLPNRPAMDPTDSELQALARLSLSNDSDKIIERMICMQNPRERGVAGWFGTGDQLGASLWDIEPLCQVAGVCYDGSIMLDGCHVVSIRWKNFPRIYFQVRQTWKKLWAVMGLRSGPIWTLVGIFIFNSSNSLGTLFLIIGLALLFAAPWSITALYGGKVWGATPWLVGFEGTMDLVRLERMVFGNCINRLSYSSSSSPYCARNSVERIGVDPHATLGRPPPGERFFTLVDTGTMTVTVFSARKPPAVALLCGKEGGMLRVLLCSYERSTNALQKECVLRMETPMWDYSRLHGWVKLG